MQLSTFLFLFFPLNFHGKRTCKDPKLELYVDSTMAEKIGDRQTETKTDKDKSQRQRETDLKSE